VSSPILVNAAAYSDKTGPSPVKPPVTSYMNTAFTGISFSPEKKALQSGLSPLGAPSGLMWMYDGFILTPLRSDTLRMLEV